MLIYERYFRNDAVKERFEKSKAITASCIPALESILGGQFIHTEQFYKRAFCVTLDCCYGIDLLWVHNRIIDPIGVRTTTKDEQYFSVSCNNYNGKPSEYDELKKSKISPAYICKLVVIDDKPYKAYIVRIDYLLDYIDNSGAKPIPSTTDPHDYYYIPMADLPKNAVKVCDLSNEYIV